MPWVRGASLEVARLLIGAILLALGLRRGLLLLAALAPRRRLQAGSGVRVAVLAAFRNESARANALLESLDRLQYPRDDLQIVLGDDASDDDTPTRLHHFAQGRSDVLYVAASKAPEGKAATLNRLAALAPDAELLVVYDAKHAPEPGSLRLLVGAMADPRIGCASGYLRPRNAAASLVARYASLENAVTQWIHAAGRDRLFRNAPTIGGNCVYRRSAVERVGGFRPGATSEDTEMSLALLACGWRTRFVPEAVATTTVAESLSDFWHQRVRWNRGLYDSLARASGPETLATALGYVDRFVLVAALFVEPRWLAAYLVLPGAMALAATAKSHGWRSAPATFLAALVMLPVDIAVTVWATASALKRRPAAWR